MSREALHHERARRAVRFLWVLAFVLVFAPLWVNDRPYVIRGRSHGTLQSRLDVLADALERSERSAWEHGAQQLADVLEPDSEPHATLVECLAVEPSVQRETLRQWLDMHRPERRASRRLDALVGQLDVLRLAVDPLLHLSPREEDWKQLDDSLSKLLELRRDDEVPHGSLLAAMERASSFVRAVLGTPDARRRALLETRGSELQPLISQLDLWFSATRDERRAMLRTLDVRASSWPVRVETRWPLFASLGALEVGCMVAFLVDLLLACRRRLLAKRLAYAVGLGFVASGLHGFLAGDGRPHGPRPDMLEGRFEVQFAIHALVPWSFDASHGDRPNQPPSWWRRGREERAPEEMARDPAGTRSSFARHWLGTDELGRDLLARLVWGGRYSLGIACLAALLTTGLGILCALGSRLSRWIDYAVRTAIEIVMCFPTILVVLASVMIVRAHLGESPTPLELVFGIALVLAAFRWTQLTRLLSFEFARIDAMPFVEGARALGARPARIVLRNVLPHASTPILVFLAFEVVVATILESSLAFLGFGLPEPLPSWGHLVRGASADPSNWWSVLFPTLAIVSTLVALNAVSDALQHHFDPVRRSRANTGRWLERRVS
ncbi:MAG: ABC transporter permease [Planctomycetes bacterium]|nr:ABC transporter permease [Planctomycetota bacterium]